MFPGFVRTERPYPLLDGFLCVEARSRCGNTIRKVLHIRLDLVGN